MAEVVQFIYDMKAHVFICGGEKMATEVTDTFELALTRVKGFTLTQAKDYINQMRETSRWHEDIFEFNHKHSITQI
jgi:sulfite reductase alpha subunit-like flavoprotein